MPGIQLKDDLYVHNEAHTHTYVVNVYATCKCHVTFYHPQRYKMPKHRLVMPSVCDLLYKCGYSNSHERKCLDL